MPNLQNLVVEIARVGLSNKLTPPIAEINVFRHFFKNGEVDVASLDKRDGSCTRRELLLRNLLLNAVLDQGPDIDGVRQMMVKVVNVLYENEVRIFHSPLDFFKEIQTSVNEIWDTHEQVKSCRSKKWAEDNQSTATKYNLFMDNSKQTLNYAIFRWGMPLALPYLLEMDSGKSPTPTALIDYLEQYESAEEMSKGVKNQKRYGLGKAIGDKACHLFAKWMVSTFQLTRRSNEDSWGEYAYEVPFDSNAGRVLWRTGYFLHLASKDEYIKKDVIQRGKGKSGKHYIRVTNIRGMKVSESVESNVLDSYREICVNHLKSHSRAPTKIEIQRFQHILLRDRVSQGLTVAAFDDGLIEIGRNFCFNHADPKCENCPINQHCEGYQSADQSLIKDYRT